MRERLSEILQSIPKKVTWKEIVDFDNFDERLSSVSTLFANTIDVNEDSIEFCSDDEFSSKEEELSWIWTFRPDLSEEILKLKISDDFRMLVSSYQLSDMDKFWDYMS